MDEYFRCEVKGKRGRCDSKDSCLFHVLGVGHINVLELHMGKTNSCVFLLTILNNGRENTFVWMGPNILGTQIP